MTVGPDLAAPPLADTARARDGAIDGLRALAALAVLATHVGDQVGTQTARVDVLGLFDARTGFAVQELNVGVDIFFVVSAFLVYRPFVAASVRGAAPPAAMRFLVRRFWRIYPAYWLALGVIVAFSATRALPDLGTALAHASLGQGWSTSWLRGGYGLRQAWTLSVEVSFYLAVPLFAWAAAALARRLDRARAHLLFACGLVVIGYGLAVLLQYHHPAVLPPLFVHLAVFSWGVLFAVLDVVGIAGRPFRLRVWPCWLAAALLFGWFVQTSGIDPAVPFTLSDADQLLQRIVHGLIAALVVAPIVAIPLRPDGVARRALAWRPLRTLGLWSYGFYLWHYWMIEVLADNVVTDGPQRFAVLFVTSALAATACGAASWYLVERPAMRRSPWRV